MKHYLNDASDVIEKVGSKPDGLTTEEAEKFAETKAVSAGKLVYEDEAYKVYHFDSVKEIPFGK